MKAIQEWLAEHQAQMTNELETLCNLNSGSDNLNGLHQVADWLTEYFLPIGKNVERIELPTYTIMDDVAVNRTQATGPALRWNVRGSAACEKKKLLLTIHYDTVYGPENPFQACERYEAIDTSGQIDARMRGPGVIDAKGGIVVLRWAVLAAQKFLDLSKLDLSIVLTPDEEIGSPASSDLWKQISSEFDFAMLYEPSMADGSLVSTRKGTGTFSVVVRGKAAHSGRNFHEGRNAVTHACQVALAINALNDQRPDVTINVGRLRGGEAVNVVPDLAVLRVNARVSTREDQIWIESEMQQIGNRFHSPQTGYCVEITGGITSPPKNVDETSRLWMEHVEMAGRRIGETISWKPSGGASDGNKLAALGLSNIDTFGPEGNLLHSNQEWVRLSSLPRKAALTAAVLASLCDVRSHRPFNEEPACAYCSGTGKCPNCKDDSIAGLRREAFLRPNE